LVEVYISPNYSLDSCKSSQALKNGAAPRSLGKKVVKTKKVAKK